jgi:hypothetical protein
MAANVQINTNARTVTVTVTAGLGSAYNPGTASVQLANNASGAILTPVVVVTPANPMMGTPASATYTFNGVAPGGYTVVVTCGGDATSAVTTVQSSVGVM